MLRTVVEFIAYLLLFILLRAILRGIFAGSRQSGPPQTAPHEAPEAQDAGELKRDPVCGTYVSAAASVTRTVHGQVFYFCSKDCRDRYAG